MNEFCDRKFGNLFIENDGTSLLHINKYIFIPGYINFLIEIIKPWILKSSVDGWGALFFNFTDNLVCCPLQMVYFRLIMYILCIADQLKQTLQAHALIFRRKVCGKNFTFFGLRSLKKDLKFQAFKFLCDINSLEYKIYMQVTVLF